MCEAQGFQKELNLFFGSCQDGEISHEEGVGLRLFGECGGCSLRWQGTRGNEDRGKFASYAPASSLFSWDNQCRLLHHRNWQQCPEIIKRVAQKLWDMAESSHGETSCSWTFTAPFLSPLKGMMKLQCRRIPPFSGVSK